MSTTAYTIVRILTDVKKVPRIGIDNLAFGERLRKLREARDWKPADLASKSGLSAQAINKYETNFSAEPEFFNGLALADALGISPYQLAGKPEAGRASSTPPADADEKVAPPRDLVEVSRDLRLLAAEVQAEREKQSEILRRIEMLETSAPRARRRAS